MKKYDLIVVGAGNGGLMAGAYASKAGLRTLILEKHNIPGGSATSFRRGRFEFEASLHEMAEVGTESNPGAVRAYFSGIGAKVDWINEDHTFRAVLDTPELKYDILLPSEVERFCDEIEKQVPGSRESVSLFFDYAKKARETVNILVSKKIKFKDIPAIFDVLRLTSNSTDEFMDLLGIPKKAQYLLSTYWPYMGEATDTLNAFTLPLIDYLYVHYGAGIAAKFSFELSLSLDEAIRRYGGEIWYNSEVTKILVKNKAVYGVVVNEEEIFADHVICNCYPDTVFGKLIDKNEVPVFENQKANARTIGLSFFAVYLGLNKSAEEIGFTDYTTFIQEYPDSKRQMEACYGLGGDGLIIANCLNVVIPDCSPKGTCHVSFTCPVYGDEWGQIKPEEYKKKKLELAEKVISKSEKALGISIKPYIEEIEVATPVTFARYINTPNGSPYGYQLCNWDGMFTKTMNVEKELTIKGLRFCGAHTEKGLGFNVTYESGITAVERTLKDMKKRKKGTE